MAGNSTFIGDMFSAGGPESPLGKSGGGGYGVTTSNQGNNKLEQVPQVDPSQALSYFAQAATAQTGDLQAGIAAYQVAMQQANNQMISGYQSANSTLLPLSNASQQALILQQQMLGITPQPLTNGYGATLTSIDPNLSSTAQLINQLSTISDPGSRSQLYNQINSQITQAQQANTTAPNLSTNVNVGGYTATSPTYDEAALEDANFRGSNNGVFESLLGTGSSPTGPTWTQETIANADVAAAQQQNAANQQQLASFNAGLPAAQQQNQLLSNFQSQFQNNYQPTLPVGFTGQQASNQVASTPGYQFQLDQGAQQVLRNQAAIGNLGTGGTQAALTNYGQNYAQNAYNSYMTNLSNVVNQGIPATTQIAANQANQGTNLAQNANELGQAENTTQQNIGIAQANALNNQGQTSYNAAALNTQLQYDAYALNQAGAQASSAQASSLGGQLAQIAANGNQANQSGSGYYQGVGSIDNNTNQEQLSNAYTVGSNGGAI